MLQPKAIGCLLLTISLACGQSVDDGNFEDADRGSDFITSSFGDADGQWDLRHSIPGEPEIDYPIYSTAPKTSFSCDNRHEGYYADVETRCQVFRICTNTDLSGEGFAFLCPNGTLFSQKDFVCDWYRNVDCTESENYYFKNEVIGNIINKDDIMEAVKQMVEFPMRTIANKISQTSSLPKESKSKIESNQSNRDINQNNKNSDTSSKGTIKDQITEEKSIENVQTNNNNDRTRTKTSRNQQQQRTRNGQHNGNENVNHNRNNNERKNRIDSREQQRQKTTSSISLTKDETESGDLRSFTTPKVYVNSLGELSTDPGVNFDPRTSFIIGASEDSKTSINNDHSRGQKKSLDDVLGDSPVYKNHLESERKEKLKEGLPGSENKNARISSKSKTIATNTGNSHDNIDHSAESSKSELSFAQRINAGLNGLTHPSADGTDLTTNSNGSHIPEFVRNFIDKKTPRKNSPSRIEEDHGKFINLADNVNGGFLNDHDRSHSHYHSEYHLDRKVNNNNNQNNNQNNKPNNKPNQHSHSLIKATFGERNLAEPINAQVSGRVSNLHNSHVTQTSTAPRITSKITTAQPFSTTRVASVGKAFNGIKSTEAPKVKPVVNEYRQGRQFQFLGSGFTRAGQKPVTLAPFQKNNNQYLPPAHVQPFISPVDTVDNYVHSSRVSSNGRGLVPLQNSIRTSANHVTSSKQTNVVQHTSNKAIFKGPGVVTLGSSLPVQTIPIKTETTNQISTDIISSSSSSKDVNTPTPPSKFYLPPLSSGKNEQQSSNIPNLLLMVGDINAAEETESPLENENDSHVKRRAEALLLQGFHQTSYENEFTGNSIDANFKLIGPADNHNNISDVLGPLVIRVDDEFKDSDVTNIEKLLVGNIRNFLRSSVTNEIENNENVDSSTITNNETYEDGSDTTQSSIIERQVELTTQNLNLTFEHPTLVTEPNFTTDLPPNFDLTTIYTETEIFNTTESSAQLVTTLSNDIETTTVSTTATASGTEKLEDKKTTPAIRLGNFNARRLTVKPINYSKKPFTLRNYSKTSTTSKPNKLTNNNNKRRPLNRFALKENANNNKLAAVLNNTENDSSDLIATENSYKYRPVTTLSRIRNQNDTNSRYTRIHRFRPSINRNRNTTTTTSTTISPNSSFSSSKFNLTISNLIPLDILAQSIGNTESNLQNSRYQQSQHVKNQKTETIFKGPSQPNKQFQQQFNPITPPKSLYTSIPGTNIKISKSNEEASFSVDNNGLRQQPVNNQQTGYVPLEQYITQTLTKTLQSSEAQPKPQINALGNQITPHPPSKSLNQNGLVIPFPTAASPTIAPTSYNPFQSPVSIISSPSIIQSNKPLSPSLTHFSQTSQTNNNLPHLIQPTYTHHTQNIPTSQKPFGQQQFVQQYPQIQQQHSQVQIHPEVQQHPQVQQHSQSQTHSQPQQQVQYRTSYTSTGTGAVAEQQNRALQSNLQQPHSYQFMNQQTSVNQQPISDFLRTALKEQQLFHTHPVNSQQSSFNGFNNNQYGSVQQHPVFPGTSQQTQQQQQSSRHHTFDQFVQQNAQTQYNTNKGGYQPFPPAIFNEIPVAQRRLDLVEEDTRDGKSLYSGVSSYHVPIGSVGRLPADVPATKRLKRQISFS